jgi:uncharacterized protein (DUF1015 family)
VSGPLEQLVSPPYDVIDGPMRASLAARSPYSFVELDLPESGTEDRYAHAAALYRSWLSSGVMRQDEAPSFYIYWQRFAGPDGREVLRKGFLGLTRLHEYADKVVLPHERTLSGPKADRLALMVATQAQLSQIFLLYSDPAGVVDAALAAATEAPPLLDTRTEDGVHHQVWSISDPAAIATVRAQLADERLLIADGHHRYETALGYARNQGALGTGGPAAFTLAFFANADDPGLVVLPTHRGLHDVAGFDAAGWLGRTAELFDFTTLEAATAPSEWLAALRRAGETGTSFVLATAPQGELSLTLATLNAARAASEQATMQGVAEMAELDVAILHELLLERRAGISREAQAAKTNIFYYKEAGEALADLAAGRTQAAIFMNGTPVAKVRAICEAGDFMPQKSTFFFPKVLSGVVLYDLTGAR